MGPKLKKGKSTKDGGQPPRKRSRTQAPPEEPTPEATPPQNVTAHLQMPVIDYDQLAAAMRRQMGSCPPLQNISSLGEPGPAPPPAAVTQENGILPPPGPFPVTPGTSNGPIPAAVSGPSLPVGPPQLRCDTSATPIMSLLEKLFSQGGSYTGAMACPDSNTGPGSSTSSLSPETFRLLAAATANRTKIAYLRSWQLLNQFMQPCTLTLPVSIATLCNFISHLFANKYSPATITSHVSAISYVHKLMALEDPTHTFLIRKMLKGCQNLTKSVDTRLPITKDILDKLVAALDVVIGDPQVRLMLRTLFLVAFHAFMRLGELVCKSQSDSASVLQRSDVAFVFSGPNVTVDLTLRNFKNNTDGKPVSLHLAAKATPALYCPVQSLHQFCQSLKHTAGPLFQLPNGSPVTYSYVTQRLNQAISFIGLDPSLYKAHSFRIGAATQACQNGHSISDIQRWGRWNSNAVQRYIRLNAFQIGSSVTHI